MLIIGLDLGTQITGITILNGNQTVIFQDCWKIKTSSKIVDLFDKIAYCKEKLENIKKEVVKNEEVKIIIEQNLQMYKRGKSSAKVLNVIAKFNGCISFLCFDIFKIKPSYIAASSARKRCGIKIDSGIQKNAKEQTLDFVIQNWGLKVEYTSKGAVKDYFYDISDSWVLAKSFFIKSS
jgi:hypothetical protein